MKNLFLVFTLLIILNPLFGQDKFIIEGEMNYGTYDHTNIKLFQEELNKVTGLPTQITDSYPDFYGYRLLLGVLKEKVANNFYFDYRSTGGKISYADYSGKYGIETLLQAYTLGYEYDYGFIRSKYFSSFLVLRLSGMYNDFSFNEYLTVNEFSENETYFFDSFGASAGAGLKFSFDLKKIIISTSVSYENNISLYLTWKEDSKVQFRNLDNKPVDVNWTGMRVGMSLGIPFVM